MKTTDINLFNFPISEANSSKVSAEERLTLNFTNFPFEIFIFFPINLDIQHRIPHQHFHSEHVYILHCFNVDREHALWLTQTQ